MSKPSLVLPTGAWHVPAHYEKLIHNLEGHGYKCHPVMLPSMDKKGGKWPDQPLQADIDAIRNAILTGLEHSDVILVLHSYGGFPGMSACKGLSPSDRKQAGFSTSVLAIAGIAFFMVPAGTSLLQAVGGKPHPIHDVSDDQQDVFVTGDPKEWFYADCTPEDAKRAESLLVKQAWHANLGPGQFSAYKDILTHYLICTEDAALPEAVQKGWIDAARADGGNVVAEEIKSSHSPFLSRVEETADYIRRVAGEPLPSNLKRYDGQE